MISMWRCSSKRLWPGETKERERFGVPAELAERLCGRAGFRNILVHEYLSIDHSMLSPTEVKYL